MLCAQVTATESLSSFETGRRCAEPMSEPPLTKRTVSIKQKCPRYCDSAAARARITTREAVWTSDGDWTVKGTSAVVVGIGVGGRVGVGQSTCPGSLKKDHGPAHDQRCHTTITFEKPYLALKNGASAYRGNDEPQAPVKDEPVTRWIVMQHWLI